METPRHSATAAPAPVAAPVAARTLDYAPPARPAVSWGELWSYREPVLIRHPRLTWRIALILVLLYALTPIFAQGGFDMRMLHAMGLTALVWAFIARLVLDLLVVIHRFAESVQERAEAAKEEPASMDPFNSRTGR